MHPLLNIIGIKISTYYIFFYSAITISFLLFLLDAKRRGYLLSDVFKFGIFLVLFTLVLSRLLFLLVYLPKIGFKSYILTAIRFWQGGISILTAVIAGIFMVILLTKFFKVDRFDLLDLVSSPLALGQAIGRIGCFMAGCCYGKPTTFFLGVVFNHPDSLAPQGIKIHPVQLYESLGNLIIFLFLRRKIYHQKFKGEIFSLYLFLYSSLRLILEKFRAESLFFYVKFKNFIFNFNFVMFLCVLGILTALLLYKRRRFTPQN